MFATWTSTIAAERLKFAQVGRGWRTNCYRCLATHTASQPWLRPNPLRPHSANTVGTATTCGCRANVMRSSLYVISKKIETILYGARFYQALRQRCNRGVTAYIINPATSNIHRMYERSVTQNVTFSSPPLLHHKSARDSWNICGGSHNSAHSLCDVQKCTTSYPRTISTPSYAHANNTHLLRFGVILLIFFFSFSSLYRIKWWPRASSLTT